MNPIHSLRAVAAVLKIVRELLAIQNERATVKSRIFLYALAWSWLTRLFTSAIADNRLSQVALGDIRQYLANLVFGRGILHA